MGYSYSIASCQYSLCPAFSARLLGPQCSLHSRNSKETRGVKTFPTKTRREVGMVPRVSEEHVCLHGKTNWCKNSRNKEGYYSMLTNRGEHFAASMQEHRGVPPCSTTQVIILRHHISKTLWRLVFPCRHTCSSATRGTIPTSLLVFVENVLHPLYIHIQYTSI